MEKNAMLDENSQSDFDNTKKAEFYDADGFAVADAANKDKLKNPRPVKELDETPKN